MHVIPFDHPVPDEERDNRLDEKLRAEAPQILHWLIEACLEWQECGLGLPDKISNSTETYLQSEDVLAQWMDEACDRDTDSESSALYKCYCEWADEQGEKVWSRRAWANALVERGFKTKRGKAGVRMFCALAPRLAPAPSSGYQVP
jgi:putative DNA primase/helicase